MQRPPPIVISLSSFGAAEVRRHGQAWFARLAARAGADGVEIRGELLTGGDAELDAIEEAAGGLQRVYSSPEPLWSCEGTLDERALDRGLAAAARIEAQRLKMSIGGYADPSASTLVRLRERLDRAPADLVIENDQTPSAGTLPALQRFFEAAERHDLALGMTFDMGNWHWQGECPQQAAQALARHVCYVHCKGVQRERQRWIAVPLADSAAPWRAVLRAMPPGVPWAIEYPLIGDDLQDTTRRHVDQLRDAARSL